MNSRYIVRPRCVLLVLISMLAAAPLLADGATAQSCDQVYAACAQKAAWHRSCSAEHAPSLVTSAISLFELEQRLQTPAQPAVFGSTEPDDRVMAQLRSIRRGLRATAPAELLQPGTVERVLIQDLHRRHADRLEPELKTPRDCAPKALRRLERLCRAGQVEAESLTRRNWPADVGSCG